VQFEENFLVFYQGITKIPLGDVLGV